MAEVCSKVYVGSWRNYIRERVGSWRKYVLVYAGSRRKYIMDQIVGSWRNYILECMLDQEGSISWRELDHGGSIF